VEYIHLKKKFERHATTVDLMVHLPRTIMVCVFDNKVSNSRLYVEERIGVSGSFILIARISFSIQEDKY